MGVPINTPTLHFSRDALRAIDQDAIEKYRVPSIVLMENAAIGAAKLIHEGWKDSHSKISVVCGSGNNGGDGYATARHLGNLGLNIVLGCNDPVGLQQAMWAANINNGYISGEPLCRIVFKSEF